jgi:hypothetical protein
MSIALSADAKGTNLLQTGIELHIGTELHLPAI